MASSGERVVIVGGNAAGLTAAARAKRLRPELDIVVLEQGPFISYSTCGVPYFVADIVRDSNDLIVFTAEEFERKRGATVRTETQAVDVIPSMRRVVYLDLRTQRRGYLRYDKLLIATGCSALVPEIEGVDLKGVFTVVNLQDGIKVKEALAELRPRTAAVVGAGYVGLEMAEALRLRGLQVTVLEKKDSILREVDPDISVEIEEELRRNGVRLVKNAEVVALEGDDKVKRVVYGKERRSVAADMVLLDTGIKPNVELAVKAGVKLGKTGAIAVDEHMETNILGIYAAGNCAEAKHLVTGGYVIDALGTVASKQGRVAGENMAGRRSLFSGVVGTMAVKVFGLAVASTGLSAGMARSLGFKVAAARITAHSTNRYYPGGGPLTVKAVMDRETRRLLGAQIVGKGEAAKRIDVLATAISNRMRVDEIAQLDLSYAPPFAPLWDPILVAMNAGLRELEK